MIPTLKDIQTWFDEFNASVFKNDLPKVKMTITNTRHQLGQFYWGNGRGIGIKISAYYDAPVDDLRNTVLHEMCHLYCYWRGWIHEGHRERWLQIAEYATRKTGLAITRTNDISEYISRVSWVPFGVFGRENMLKILKKRHYVLKMVIPEGVIGIGDGAFSGCLKLKEIHIPGTVKKIGDVAFSGCRALTDVRVPDSVTEIGRGAFGGCTKLTDIHLPDGLTKIGDGAFSSCSSLVNIRIPYDVSEIGDRAFEGCFKLSAIDIPGSVKRIGQYAFRQCNSLKEVYIPEGVTEIGDGAFQSCSELSVIHIPGSVVKIGASALDECPNLNKIIIDPENTVFDSREDCNAIIETETGTLIQGSNLAFVPQGVTKVGDNAFSGFNGITEVSIPESVTDIGEKAFHLCSGLRKVHIPNSVKHIGEDAFKSCPVILEGTTQIDDFSFSGVEFSEVVIPSSVTKIAEDAFAFCKNIKAITVSPENKSFDSRDGCNGIVDTATNVLILGCENTVIPEGVIEIGYGAFANCFGPEEITVPESVTKIGRGAFYNCTGLSKIFIPDSVTEVGESAFEGCCNLVSLIAPEGLDIKAAKVPRKRGRSIIARYSPNRKLQTLKRFAIDMPGGVSIPVEYSHFVDDRVVITNWPAILETASDLGKDEIEGKIKEYDYGSLPFFVLSVLDVLKDGYDRLPDVLPGLEIIADPKLRERLSSLLIPVLDSMTERERQVFELYYGMGCKSMTLAAIGAKLELTQERARQIKEKAYRKVKMYCLNKL